MRLLLDTHVLIWWDEGARLSAAARRAIREADQVYVSAVSGWEIAIKTALGRLRPTRTAADAVVDSAFEELPVRLRHAETLGRLASDRDHRDPFDRMLAAQALAEGLIVVTRDPAFERYGVRVIGA
ncbi:MAG TPA: type II toxin-antitoxin system VapC family toxin [Gemmatimonadales bacterium]